LKKTSSKDLSSYKNIKEVLQIGFYYAGKGVVKAVRMPISIEKVPTLLPTQITDLSEMFKNCSSFNQDISM